MYETAPKPRAQLEQALKFNIPFVVWLAEEELKQNLYKIKCLYKKEEYNIKQEELV